MTSTRLVPAETVDVDYAEFTAEVARLYDEDDEKGVVLLADEYPDYYLRYARENDLLDDEDEVGEL